MSPDISSILEIQNHPEYSVVRFFGFVDASTVERIKPAINAKIPAACARIIISLDKVEFLDSHGVGLFVSLLKMVHGKKGLLIFAGARDQAASVLNMVGFNSSLVTYCDTLKDACDLMEKYKS